MSASTHASPRQRFERDGFVALRGFLRPPELASLRGSLERFLALGVDTMPADQVYREDRTKPDSLKQLQHLETHDPGLGAMLHGSRFSQLAETLLGERVAGQNLQFFDKPPGLGAATPPHQDAQYFLLEPSHALTMWLALDEVDGQSGCLRVVRGSHRAGLRPHERSGVLGFSQRISDFSEADERDEVALPCRPGDLLVHHALTIHRADANASRDRHRRALGLIYYAASAREDVAAQRAYQERLARELQAQGRI